jgi:uncharacterized protein
MDLQLKQDELDKLLKSYGRVAIAFSGGVDSCFLLAVAVKVLSVKNILAVTARSAAFPKRELNEATTFCQEREIEQIIIDSEELAIDGFSQNPTNRCYLCKQELYTKIITIAQDHGIAVVLDGSNADDVGDFRPGMQAKAELGVSSPLLEAGLTKNDIRSLSKQMGLASWNKQSFACLSSRFPYGETIDITKLAMVEQAEQLLLDQGFSFVRVRIHGTKDYIARIEVLPAEMPRLLKDKLREQIITAFKQYGFAYVTIDIKGYRTGSMNEVL